MSKTDKKPNTNSSARTVISARADIELKESFEREAPLRGHTPSQAAEIALKLGLPIYLRKYRKQFQRIGEAA